MWCRNVYQFRVSTKKARVGSTLYSTPQVRETKTGRSQKEKEEVDAPSPSDSLTLSMKTRGCGVCPNAPRNLKAYAPCDVDAMLQEVLTEPYDDAPWRLMPCVQTCRKCNIERRPDQNRVEQSLENAVSPQSPFIHPSSQEPEPGASQVNSTPDVIILRAKEKGPRMQIIKKEFGISSDYSSPTTNAHAYNSINFCLW